jgi:ornithine cyclodeaminase
MRVIYDDDLIRLLPMNEAVSAVEQFFVTAACGGILSPPRHHFALNDGGLTFAIGADPACTRTLGFRVYDTFEHREGTNTQQVVAVFDSDSGDLKGLVVGSLLGAIRTAAIGGVAMKFLAPAEVNSLTIFGAGFQAYFQLAAALCVRRVQKIFIVSRTRHKAETLAERISSEFGTETVVTVDGEASVRQSNVIICATSSPSPVLHRAWLGPGAYVASIGPKFATAHELPVDVGESALLVSDAPEQLSRYPESYFLSGTDDILPLEGIVTERKRAEGVPLKVFLSSGRTGTEVVVANHAITRAALNGEN